MTFSTITIANLERSDWEDDGVKLQPGVSTQLARWIAADSSTQVCYNGRRVFQCTVPGGYGVSYSLWTPIPIRVGEGSSVTTPKVG